MINLNRIKKNRNEMLFFGILFLVSISLSFPINFPGGQPKGGTEFFADKAAYYVYLPATFIYHWDIKKFPEKIDEKTRGFTLNYKRDRLIIKHTCGVALFLLPFFLPTHFFAKVCHLQPDGFSLFYQQMMTLPGIVYLIIGLFFLRRFLSWYFPKKITYLTVFLVFTGTNLFFYSVDEGLMSHVYSFFLFSTVLFLTKKFLEDQTKAYSTWLLMSLVFSLAILLRPTNILFISILAFLDSKSIKESGKRILFFLKPLYSISFVVILFLVMVPQMIYWHYLSGHYLYDSYPEEGFTNLTHPMIIPILFATLNCLFLYTHLILFFIAGIVIMILKKIPNGLFIGVLFLVISYLFSSWITWFFGGSLGSRPFVEYFSILALPFGYMLNWIFHRGNLLVRNLFFVTIVLFSYYNLRLCYHFNCFPGSIWSWDDYKIYLSDAGIQHFPKKSYSYINDFENNTLPDEIPRGDTIVHSRTRSSYLDSSLEFNCKYSRRLDEILDKRPVKVTAGIWIHPDRPDKTSAFLVCSISDRKGINLYYKTIGFDKFAEKIGEWSKVEDVFHFPEWIPPSTTVSFYIWNPNKNHFHIDDFTLKFE